MSDPLWGSASAAIPVTGSATAAHAISGSASGEILVSALAGGLVIPAGSVFASIGVTARGLGVHDFTTMLDPITHQNYWAMDVDDGIMPRLRIPISSWQASLVPDRSSYAACVIPAADRWVGELRDRSSAHFYIYRGVRFPTGETAETMFASAPLGELRYDIGPRNSTATISGYARLYSSDDEQAGTINTRKLPAVRSISNSNGRWRVRSSIDWWLRPNSVAVLDDGQEFVVEWVNYYCNTTDEFMEIGSRG